MTDYRDRVYELYRALRNSSRDAFLFQNVLAELSEEELRLLEKICAAYEQKRAQSRPHLVGYRHREDLDPSLGTRLKRLFSRKN